MKKIINIKQRPDIIVFSHLRWDSVTQRPHHILILLSKKRRILFVEEPIEYTPANKNTDNIYTASKKITVLQPRIETIEKSNILEKLVKKQLKALKFSSKPILWFYSPQFIAMQAKIDHSLVVYDCMDELSGFAGAPANLQKNEHKLLTYADIVFTGGKSIFESKRKSNPHTYCFPSSVDEKHFKKAVSQTTKIALDIAKLPRPLVGYYGVIDERLDYELLKKVADILPNVSFVMIGPFAKIDPDSLPQSGNLYYLGKKDYNDLPNYLKAFDLAMMPFARNSATKFISPTKTLEYMAGEKLIVSTPIKDVERDYNHVVSIASDPDSFADAIKKLLNINKDTKKLIIKLQNNILASTSWKNTGNSMEKIVDSFILKNNRKTKVIKDVLATSL